MLRKNGKTLLSVQHLACALCVSAGAQFSSRQSWSLAPLAEEIQCHHLKSSWPTNLFLIMINKPKSQRLYRCSLCFSEVSTRWWSYWWWAWVPATKFLASHSLLWVICTPTEKNVQVMLLPFFCTLTEEDVQVMLLPLLLWVYPGVKNAFPKRGNVMLRFRSQVIKSAHSGQVLKSAHSSDFLWLGRKAE